MNLAHVYGLVCQVTISLYLVYFFSFIRTRLIPSNSSNLNTIKSDL